MSTNAQLTQQINTLLAAWNEREAQFRAWLAGIPTGGPNGDGKYPLSDASGDTQLVDSPAKLADTVGGPAGLSRAAQLLSEAARDAAIVASDRVLQAETQVTSLRDQARSDRNLAQLYRDEAASFASNATALRDTIVAAASNIDTSLALSEGIYDETELLRVDALGARDESVVARNAAQTFRDQAQAFAASINPAQFAPASHTHTIAHVLGLQSALDSKAAGFHTHAISDVTGLQSALDTKAPRSSPTFSGLLDLSGSQLTRGDSNGYALFVPKFGTEPFGANYDRFEIRVRADTQTTEIGNTHGGTGSPRDLALMAGTVERMRIASGGAVSIPSGTLTVAGRNILSEIDSKAAGFHTHAISDVTGLQAALDARMLRTGGTFTGAIEVVQGGNVSTLTGDGSLELVRLAANGGGPYIDFRDALSDDFDVRLQAVGNVLNIAASVLNVGGTPVSLAGHTHSISQITNLQAMLDNRMIRGVDQWITSTDGRSRFFFANNGRSYFGSPDGYEWRSASDVNIMELRNNGDMMVHGQTTWLRSAAPTVWWWDTDQRTFAIHVNDSLAYFMRGGVNDANWTALPNGEWPMVINLSNGNVRFGNDIAIRGVVYNEGLVVGRPTSGANVNVANDTGSFSVRGDVNNAAAMSFHRVGAYAINMGLGTDNVFRIGGWSATADAFRLDPSGNLSVTGTLRTAGHLVWHAGNFDPNTKANTSHTHTIDQISDLEFELTSIKNRLTALESAGGAAPPP